MAILAVGCASPAPSAEDLPDLPVGALTEGDSKADGNWGAATACKDVPDLPALVDPEITISLHGLTLHLRDEASGYDRVFPIGPGAIDEDPASPTFGESLSYFPLRSGKTDFTIDQAGSTACKIWWKDPATGESLPVFAGLPFLRWSGSYGIHGPIDGYRAPNGGALRRGFVSHGCIRMEAADVLELWARVRGLPSVVVHVQREPERDEAGRRVDVESRWMGAECEVAQDCPFAGAVCHDNAWSGRAFCTRACTKTCPDAAGQPSTFCVEDESDPGHGICVPRAQPMDRECRPYDHFVEREMPRMNNAAVRVAACVPGSPGWIGDRCLDDDDCLYGTSCGEGGTCTMPCTRYCDDEPGWPSTFCVAGDAGGTCARRCDLTENAAECPAGLQCLERARNGAPVTRRTVCLPPP